MNALSVTDSLSNKPEHIEVLAGLVGKGRKRDVFALIYGSQKQKWSVPEIAEALSIPQKQASTAAAALAAGNALHQDKVGNRSSYRKVPAHRTIKEKVLKLAGNKNAIEAIVTKRRPVISGALFVQATRMTKTRASPRKRKPKPSMARVAFLMASPGGAGAINVGMDYREALKAVQASSGRDKLDLKPFPAADVGSLLDALNEYRPDVMHFSGHGATDLVLLDSGEVKSNGGTILDFSVAKQMLKATSSPPKCLVLMACQTAKEASAFFDVVPIVIAMSNNISDFAAAFFCRRFYAAIAAGQTIDAAFEQAKAYLFTENLKDAEYPTLLVAPDSTAEITFVS